MGCIPAKACKKALADATARWPGRNRASDGICGDAAHQARKSDHNVGNAFDLTHDPLNGVDCHQLSQVVSHDPRVTYVIWNKRILKTRQRELGWQNYTGPNPHTKHMHVSIKETERDNLSPWPWSGGVNRTVKRGDIGMAVKLLQTKLKIKSDGIFGTKTEFAVREFQRQHGLNADGIVGSATWEKLLAQEEGEH